MIVCQACDNQNPIGTRYCRACGTKIEVKPEQVLQSVLLTQAENASSRWYERGRSALIIGLFLLTTALTLRYGVVPPMPPADVPTVEVGGFLPPDIAAPAAGAAVAPTEAAAPAAEAPVRADSRPRAGAVVE